MSVVCSGTLIWGPLPRRRRRRHPPRAPHLSAGPPGGWD